MKDRLQTIINLMKIAANQAISDNDYDLSYLLLVEIQNMHDIITNRFKD